MALFGNFRIAPGVRLSTSSRGLRLHAGPRMARVHVGGGRTGVSTGAGPFTWYENVGTPQRGAGGVTSKLDSGMSPAQAERARRAAEVEEAWALLRDQHRVDFQAVTEPVPVSPNPVPMFEVLLRSAEKKALSGVPRWDRDGRRTARRTARDQAEAEALAILEQGMADRSERQAAADAHWTALLAGEQAATEAALAAAFGERGIRVLVRAVSTEVVHLSIELPGDEVVPTHAPGVTAAGAPTVKKTTKTQLAAAVREVAAARVLLAAKEALAASPSTRIVQVEGGFGGRPIVLRANLSREALSDAPWSMDAWDVLLAVDPDLEVNVGGRTHELRPLR